MPKKVPGYLFMLTDGHRNFGDPYARNAVFYTPHIQITKDIYKNKKNYQSQALCEIIIATIYKKIGHRIKQLGAQPPSAEKPMRQSPHAQQSSPTKGDCVPRVPSSPISKPLQLEKIFEKIPKS